MQPDRIFLVGFMGAGKTTCGKLLASRLGYSFIDLDATIELIEGRSVSRIFNEDGEKAFRAIESSVLKRLEQKTGIVVATGGGCGAIHENMVFMKQNGLCIYLKSQPGVLFHRLAPQKKTRPLISDMGDVELMEFILTILPIREYVYRQADLIINGETEAEKIAEEIISLIHHQSFSGLETRRS